MNGRGFTKKKLLEIDKIPFDNMTDDDYMCGKCYTGIDYAMYIEKHSAIPKKIY